MERVGNLDRKYNGWSNSPSWGSYRAAEAIVAQAGDAFKGGEELHDWVKEASPVFEEASLYNDLLVWCLHGVDWEEVARGLAPKSDEAT